MSFCYNVCLLGCILWDCCLSLRVFMLLKLVCEVVFWLVWFVNFWLWFDCFVEYIEFVILRCCLLGLVVWGCFFYLVFVLSWFWCCGKELLWEYYWWSFWMGFCWNCLWFLWCRRFMRLILKVGLWVRLLGCFFFKIC